MLVKQSAQHIFIGGGSSEPGDTTNVVDVLDHVVAEFDVDRIVRTDEIDGAPPCVVRGAFDAWTHALRAVIRDAILVSPVDQPVWLHVVATRREVTLWVRDAGGGLLPACDVEALIDGPLFAPVKAAVNAAGGALDVESVGAWGGCTVQMVLPLVKSAPDHARVAA